MTGKRFTMKWNNFMKCNDFFEDDDYLSDRKVTERLNVLHEENEQSQSTFNAMDYKITQLQTIMDKIRKDNIALKEENKELKKLNIPIDKIKDTVVDCQGRVIGVYYDD